jgi:hypothetical protein
VNEASYTAWDDNLYEWPPPDGWYQADDGKWWPQGYGPTGASPADGNGTDDALLYEVERTSIFPAGGSVLIGGSSEDRLAAESNRPVYDELPNIDDVFGDPADDAEPEPVDSVPVDSVPVDSVPGADDTDGESSAGETSDGESFDDDEYLDDVHSDDLRSDDEGFDDDVLEDEVLDEEILDDGLGVAALDSDTELEADAELDLADRVVDGEQLDELGYPDDAVELGEAGPVRADVDGELAADESDVGVSADRLAAAEGLDGESLDAAFDAVVGEIDADHDYEGYDGVDTDHVDADHVDADHVDADHVDSDHVDADHVDPDHVDADHVDPDHVDADHVDDDERHEEPVEAGVAASDGADILDTTVDEQTAMSDAASTVTGFHLGELPESEQPDHVTTESSTSAASSGADDHADEEHDDDEYDDTADGGEQSRSIWPVIAIAALVVAVGFVIIAFLLFGGDDDSGAFDAEAALAVSGEGSLSEPYPAGTGAIVYYPDDATGDERRWVVQIVEPVRDRTDELVADRGAVPPAAGDVLAATNIRVTYREGPVPGSMSDLSFKSIGSSLELFDTANACRGMSDPLDQTVSLEPGQAVEGDLCWRIPEADLDDLKLAIEAGPVEGIVFVDLG